LRITLTQHIQEFCQVSPGPFPRSARGPGYEATSSTVSRTPFSDRKWPRSEIKFPEVGTLRFDRLLNPRYAPEIDKGFWNQS